MEFGFYEAQRIGLFCHSYTRDAYAVDMQLLLAGVRLSVCHKPVYTNALSN